MALPARFQHVAQQEQPGELETVLKVLFRPAVAGTLASSSALAQEARQAQQPVTPGLAGGTRYRAAGFRRDIGEVGGLPGRGAVFEIKPEAELGEHRQLKADQMN